MFLDSGGKPEQPEATQADMGYFTCYYDSICHVKIFMYDFNK